VPVPRLEERRERGACTVWSSGQALQTLEPGDPTQLRLDAVNRRIGDRRTEHGGRTAARPVRESGLFCRVEVAHMCAVTSPAPGRVYGVQRLCAAYAFPRASYYATNPAAPAPRQTRPEDQSPRCSQCQSVYQGTLL